jgi:hypothetical protein
MSDPMYIYDNSVNFVLGTLKISFMLTVINDGDIADNLSDAVYQEAELANISNVQLKTTCKAEGVIQSGNKNMLIQRLLLNIYGTDDNLKLVESLMLHCWFMSLVKTEAMKLGSMNERMIFDNLRVFFNDELEVSDMTMETIKEYGLMHRVGHPYAAFLPDAICTIRHNNGNIATVGCEFKTKTNSTTEDIEKVLASKFGCYQLIDLSATRNEMEQLLLLHTRPCCLNNQSGKFLTMPKFCICWHVLDSKAGCT